MNMKMLISLFVCLQLFTQRLCGEEAPPVLPPPPDQGFGRTMIMMAIALLFFYFILWRPEQKRRKALEEQRKALAKGDRVVAMGIIGTVTNIKEHTVIVRMVDGAKLEFLKGAISEILPATSDEPKGEGDEIVVERTQNTKDNKK